MQIDDKIKFSFIGDECCSTSTEKYIKGAEWLFTDAYMCGKKAEIYNPVDKHHHSSVKYISEIAEKNMIKNLILSHTNDDNIKNIRKEVSTTYGKFIKKCYNNKVKIRKEGMKNGINRFI